MNYTDLVKETVDFYSEDTSRRAVKPAGFNASMFCYYKDPSTGNCCAIGRLSHSPEKIPQGTVYGLKTLQEVTKSVKKEYTHLFEPLRHIEKQVDLDDFLDHSYDPVDDSNAHLKTMMFFYELQGLHDVGDNWGLNSLSIQGQRKVERLNKRAKELDNFYKL